MRDIGIRLDEKGRYVYLEEVPYGSNEDGSTRVPKLKWSVLNPVPLRYSSPLLKQLTGAFKSRKKNLVEEEFDRLGIPAWKIFRPTKVKDWDYALEAVSSSIMSDFFARIIDTKEYRTLGENGQADLSMQRQYIKVATSMIKQKISKTMKEGTRVGLISNAMKVAPAMKPMVVQVMKKNGLLREDQNFTDKFTYSFSNNELQVLKEVDKLIKDTMKNMIKKSVTKE